MKINGWVQKEEDRREWVRKEKRADWIVPVVFVTSVLRLISAVDG